MDPKILSTARLVLGWTASIGAGRIVSSFAGSVPRQNVMDKVTMPVGAFVLSSVVGAVAQKHTHEQFDLAVEMIEKIQENQRKTTIHSVE